MQKKEQSKFSKMFWRVALSLLGIALILIAVCNLSLFFFGKKAMADITTRRYGGASSSRNVSYRYHWSVDYTFKDKEGKLHSGFVTKMGSDIGVKTSSAVYYFPFAPFINTLESEAEPNPIQLLYVGTGVFLIVIMNRKKK